jgi:hypothetical protein
VAGFIMKDGKSLEGTGTTSDIMMLPTQQDLAAGRDPVLGEVLKLFGHPMDPAQARRFLRAN